MTSTPGDNGCRGPADGSDAVPDDHAVAASALEHLRGGDLMGAAQARVR